MKQFLFFFLSFFSLTIQSQSVTTFNYNRAWATYFGGENYTAMDAAIDSEGNVYITGEVSCNLPPMNTIYINNFSTLNAHQSAFGGGLSDAFLVKFSPSGQVLWSTFYGGEDYDTATGITIDSNDDIYIVGSTKSINNISTPNAFVSSYSNIDDGFIAKFNSNGVRIYGTYFPGFITDIKCDNSNNFYITGFTSATNNIATQGVFQENLTQYFTSEGLTSDNGFIIKFDPFCNRIFGSYYGAGTPRSLAIDQNQNIYLAGIAKETINTSGYYATPNCHRTEKGFS